MTAQKEQNQVRITRNVLVVLFTLFASVSKAGDWCEAKNLAAASSAILTAARDGVEPVKIEGASADSRVLVKNLGMVCKDQRWIDGITKIAKATVSLSDFNYKSGRGVMTTSSGIVMDTKQCPGQYVLTVRHAVDKVIMVENKNGQREPVISIDDPIEATMTVTSGLVDGKIVKSTGKVVAIGKSANGFSQKWALVKLARPLPDRARVAFAKRDEYRGLALASIGQSFDVGAKNSPGVGNGLLSVDPSCIADSIRENGEIGYTNCWSASGASGGAIVANASSDPNEVSLRVVGLVEATTNGSIKSASSIGNKDRVGETLFTNLNAIKESIYDSMAKDAIENGCF